MDRSLNVLVLEHERGEFLQIEHHLKLDGARSTCRHVASLQELKDAANTHDWDVVLVDGSALGPDLAEAVNVIRAGVPDVPVILISGSVGEQRVNELTTLGIWDFLLKEDLHRLSHVVEHAARESVQRRAKGAVEHALRRSEARYRQVFLNATDALFVFPLGQDAQSGRYTEVNEAASNLLGYTNEELLQLSPADVVDPAERESLPAKFRDLLEKKHHRVELLMLAKDGRRIPVEISGALFDLESQPTVLGIVTDITGKKRAEEMLRQATASTVSRYRRRAHRDMAVIASVCAVVLLMANRFNAFETFSSWVLKFKAAAVDEVVVMLVFLALSLIVYAVRRSREAASVVAAHNEVAGALRDLQGELEARVQLRTAALNGTNERLQIEIAEHQRTGTMVHLQSAALNAAADAIMITDRGGTIAWANPAFAALSGYSANEFIGQNPRDLLKSGAHDQLFYKNLWSTILAGRVWRGEITNRRKDGTVYPDEMTITPVKDARGEITHFVAIKRDLTDQKKLEAQFLQAQKMESVGRLAGGIAHDFNNLLTVINGMSELAAMDLREGDPLRADLQEIHRAGERATLLTRQLLAFSRKQVMKLEVLSLTTLVADLQRMLQRLIGENITLVVAAATSEGRVKADPGQIEQVIMNLVVNARDAMPGGGILTVETEDVEIDATLAAQCECDQPGPYVLLSVSDTGTGMDDVTRGRLFEPFFTTKEEGKGTGLGLATTYGIVKQSGGGISVESELGRGTTFRIYLPRVDEVVPASQLAETVPAGVASETILVVEDEDGVRHMAQRMLESSGYTVLTARNAGEALLMLERQESLVRLMLTDVVMPGMSGPDLAARVAKTRPDLKVLFTSGHTENAALPRSLLDNATHFIGKPYTKLGLTRKVRETLDSDCIPHG